MHKYSIQESQVKKDKIECTVQYIEELAYRYLSVKGRWY